MIKVDQESFNTKGVSFSKVESLLPVPNLIHIQVDSYEDFLQRKIKPSERLHKGLQAVFLETFPVESANGEVVLEFVEYTIGEPKLDVWGCKLNNSTYAAPLRSVVRLISKETGEVREQEVYMGDIPLMTSTGTFVFNGAERVIVNQLHRSPGIFIFYDAIKEMYTSRIIPDNKGSWLEFELDNKGLLVARIDRKKKFPFTLLVKALSPEYGTNEQILSLFYQQEEVIIKDAKLKDLQKYVGRFVIRNVLNPKTNEIIVKAGDFLNEDNIDFIKEFEIKSLFLIINNGLREDNLVTYSLEKDGVQDYESALIDFLKIQKPLEYSNDNGDPEKRERNIEKAKFELNRLFFDPKTYNMSSVGRYKINSKFKYLNPGNFEDSVTDLTLRPIDIIETLKYMINCINEVDGYKFDDIDHLGNRRVRTVNELLTLQLKTGFSRMERIIKERMTMNEVLDMTPQLLISIKPVTAVINEFFGASQLSQFMDQTNPLSELTHKRRLNALGPGGLTRERAGFEVRDVHYTHYGRLCPIETPEGPNIGLIVSVAVYAKLNPYGFLETPYRRVDQRKASRDVIYLSANEEDYHVVAQANTKLTSEGEFIDNLISCRYRDDFPLKSPDEIQLIDLTPLQVISLSASLIPFLEHDDANRALMGSNMQRQAVPLLCNDAPLVGTGMEKVVAYDSGVCILSEGDGIVTKISSESIQITEESGDLKEYPLIKFKRTNQSTTINHIPLVKVHYAPEDGVIKEVTDTTLLYVGSETDEEYQYSMKTLQGSMHCFFKEGESVVRGDLLLGEKVSGQSVVNNSIQRNATVLADGQSSQGGRLALGRNVQVAFMPWCGYNFEDAIILSERLVKEDFFTSIAIEEFEIQAREGKIGKDAITRDIPNIGERAFRELDEDGIIRLGAEVQAGDILVGMVAPRGQTDLTPEYRLLHSIFGEKAREVKDVSLRVPNGHRGTVIDIKRFSREAGDDLPPSVHEIVKVFVAQKRKISVGDKMAGRHGNKGVVSTILSEHDMPFLPDGTPVDIILNPLGVPSRMNIGQIFETQLGWAAKELGVYFETPVFDGAKWEDIQDYMVKANLPTSSKVSLRDGRSGEFFEQDVFVGVIYMLKLSHMAEDKMHARSTGPYSLVTQQPLGGKAQFGGQRMGEMEVWALEAYGAAYTLQELLTVKSDDMLGRARVYESIVKGIHTIKSGVPESFNVLVKEMRSLTLDIDIIATDGELLEVSDMEDDYLSVSRRIKIDSVKKE